MNERTEERKKGERKKERFRTLLPEDFLERLLMSERSLAGHSHWSPQLWIKTTANDHIYKEDISRRYSILQPKVREGLR